MNDIGVNTQEAGAQAGPKAVPTASREEIETLIARVSLGERATLSALYDHTSAKLLAVCLRVLN